MNQVNREFKKNAFVNVLPWFLAAVITAGLALGGSKYYNDFNKRMEKSMGELSSHGLYSGGDSGRNLDCYPE